MAAPFSVWRFFLVVPPVSRLMRWTFVVVVVAAALTLVFDPVQGSRVLRPVLGLQLFAAASGFGVPARRGHYDPLLTSGHHRLAIALAHCAMSIAPGLLAWLVLAGVELIAAGGTPAMLLMPGTAAAMFLVSLFAWAITAPLPRFAGAVGWLVLVTTVANLPVGGPPGSWVTRGIDPHTPAASILAVALYPASLLGHPLRGWDMVLAAPALAAAIAALAAACRWIVRADIPLEAAQ